MCTRIDFDKSTQSSNSTIRRGDGRSRKVLVSNRLTGVFFPTFWGRKLELPPGVLTKGFVSFCNVIQVSLSLYVNVQDLRCCWHLTRWMLSTSL